VTLVRAVFSIARTTIPAMSTVVSVGSEVGFGDGSAVGTGIGKREGAEVGSAVGKAEG